MTASDGYLGATKYTLKFLPEALEEWRALDGGVKGILRKLLKKRLYEPHTPGAQLHDDLRHCYKIKLRKQAIALFITSKMMC